MDKHFTSTTWPFECIASTTAWSLDKTQQLKWLQEYLGVDYKKDSLDYCAVELCFGMLVAGEGSPPHIDTMTNIASCAIPGRPYRFSFAPSMALGTLIQGIKWIWALPPRGNYVQRFVDFHRRRPAVDMTQEQKQVRDDLHRGVSPTPFMGVHSTGWPSTNSWNAMKSEGEMPNHFHSLFPGDLNIVVDGSLHSVVNDPRFHTASLTFDDIWIGSNSDTTLFQSKDSATYDYDSD